MLSMNTSFLFDPLYEEIVTNSSELFRYFTRHIVFELFLPLSIFICVMLTLLVDWTWIPLSPNEQIRGKSLERLKKNLLE